MPEFLKRPWLQITLIAAAFAAVIWFFWPAGVPRPDETLRQRHPAGYSIVVPPGFTAGFNTRGDKEKAGAIIAEDHNYRGPAPRFVVDQYRAKPNFDQLAQRVYKPGQFLGKDAMVFNGPRGDLWNYRVMFESSGSWFEIGVALPVYTDVADDPWYEYFKSFRYEPGEKPPTTTAAPSTQPRE